jgi:hypothetical protein
VIIIYCAEPSYIYGLIVTASIKFVPHCKATFFADVAANVYIVARDAVGVDVFHDSLPTIEFHVASTGIGKVLDVESFYKIILKNVNVLVAVV